MPSCATPSTQIHLALLFSLILCAPAPCATPLFNRGYTVVPTPQQVELRAGDFQFGSGWRIDLANGVRDQDVAPKALREELKDRFGLVLNPGATAKRSLRLAIAPKAVAIGAALDRDKAALESQAYRIDLAPDAVTITANAAPGLFYGVVTFIQLLKPENGGLWLPQGSILDWPDLQLRQIYWDGAHHLDRFEELQRALRTAAFYKINGFMLKLEGHFQFASAPAIVEPWALSPQQYQQLTDYALRYHIQLIPYLDGPAHIAFILKHPEYAKLRQRPDLNYELCVGNPDSYKMLFGLFDDLLAANRGGRYFYLSTDEAYYTGLVENPQCQERTAANKLGSPGKLLAEFVTKAANYLRDKGRTVVFWGESPLKPDDVPSLPRHVVNGEVNGEQFDRAFRSHGIRQMIYTAVEGEEKLFPQYFRTPSAQRLHADKPGKGRVAEAFAKIAGDPARKNADLMGASVAAWGDMGLHTETFWLGYATATAAAWNPSADPAELMSSFYPLHFGPGAIRMDRVYQLLSTQAQFWADSWETGPSNFRKPILGSSNGLFPKPRPANDQSLPLPPLPSGDDLKRDTQWLRENGRRIDLASSFRAANEELAGLIHENLLRAQRNRYALKVFLAIAAICRHNLDSIEGFAAMDGQLSAAGAAANPKSALASLDRVLDSVEQLQRGRNRLLKEATEVWAESWHPRVAEANGRRFLHELDDIKDHLPDRTVAMSYLVYRELNLPMQPWIDELVARRNRFANEKHLPARQFSLVWKDLNP